MTDFTILAEGYVTRKQGILHASSTVVLIHDNGKSIIVDPGLDRQVLHAALTKWDMPVERVDFVFQTHPHPDHTLLSGMFANAKTIDSKYIYTYDGRMEDTGTVIPATEIEILFTPGHDITDSSLLFRTREYGRVGIAGDVFWWNDGEVREATIPDLIRREDSYAYDMENLMQSRKILLDRTDWIIPGHGKMFHVPR